MLESLSSIFQHKSSAPQVGDADIKHFIQRFLRQAVGSDAVYCLHVSRGTATVKAGSAVLVQEIRLLEFDLRRALEQEAEFSLEKLVVTT